ncbi:2900_t:CDS:2, partial [Scutellospora calospora]
QLYACACSGDKNNSARTCDDKFNGICICKYEDSDKIVVMTMYLAEIIVIAMYLVEIIVVIMYLVEIVVVALYLVEVEIVVNEKKVDSNKYIISDDYIESIAKFI